MTTTKTNEYVDFLNDAGVVETVEALEMELEAEMYFDAILLTRRALAASYRQVDDPMIEAFDGEKHGSLQLADRHARDRNFRGLIEEAEEMSRLWHSAAMAWKAAQRVRWRLRWLIDPEWVAEDAGEFLAGNADY